MPVRRTVRGRSRGSESTIINTSPTRRLSFDDVNNSILIFTTNLHDIKTKKNQITLYDGVGKDLLLVYNVIKK